jgi:cytoskeletal protein CcmA (bactofilin family)
MRTQTISSIAAVIVTVSLAGPNLAFTPTPAPEEKVDGPMTVRGPLSVRGALTVHGPLMVRGPVVLKYGEIRVGCKPSKPNKKPVRIVDGKKDVEGPLTVRGELKVEGALGVEGPVTVAGTMLVGVP